MPIELSHFLNNFLTTFGEANTLTAEVIGKIKREIGLVYPAKYCATTRSQRFAEILATKLQEKKEFILLQIVRNELKKFP